MRHGPKIHILGRCFTNNKVGLIIRNIVGKYLVFPKAAFMFQHDLAPPHKAETTQSFLKNKNIDVLSWITNSPKFHIKCLGYP